MTRHNWLGSSTSWLQNYAVAAALSHDDLKVMQTLIRQGRRLERIRKLKERDKQRLKWKRRKKPNSSKH